MSIIERPGFVSVSDYLKLPRDADTWLLEPLIPVSGAGLIYSPPKVGKTAIALQMAHAISSGAPEWMGFPIGKHGKALYFQLDTPRSTWALRFEMFKKHGLNFNDDMMKLADRETISHYPFDILQPAHVDYLSELVRRQHPVEVVFVDTLRKVHTGNENDSTVMSNVASNLIKAVYPAALVLLSHDRKPSLDAEKDIMSDHRGSTSIVGEMDGIMRLTKNRLYYAGRNIEEGSLRLQRQDVDGILLWSPDQDEHRDAILAVMEDHNLPTKRAKARSLAATIGKSEEAAMSILRRHTFKTEKMIHELAQA